MERVTGIGGIFFKARDPAALAAWYRQHLGIESKDAIAEFEWREKDAPDRIGHTVWAAFPAETRYFGTGAVNCRTQPGRPPEAAQVSRASRTIIAARTAVCPAGS